MQKKQPLKGSSLCLLFITLFLAILFLNLKTAKSDDATVYPYPTIRVSRVVQFDNGGALVINDTVTLSANASQNVVSLDIFQIGLPAEYKASLAYFFAYDTSEMLQTVQGSYSNRTEFYWIDVSFPQPLNVSDGGSYVFTVVYVFSELIKAEGTQSFRADFPLYPSLVEKADFCSVTVLLPSGATPTSSSHVFSNRTVDSRWVLNLEVSPLEPFANVPSWVKFTSGSFLILDVDELRREIRVDEWGGISGTDSYQIINRAIGDIQELSLALPTDADAISVQDIYGTYTSGVTVNKEEEYTQVKVSLREALGEGETLRLLVAYALPFDEFDAHSGWQDYILKTSLIRPNDWVIKKFLVTVSLPEGAEFQSATKEPTRLDKNLFTETIRFYDYNVTKFYESSLNLSYRYLILWASFRPTLWVGTATAIVGGVLFLRRAPKPVAAAPAPLSVEVLRRYVNAYEERRRIKLEEEALERQVQRGKTSRRQYRLRKSSLDGRLSKLQKDLAEFRKEIDATGGKYAESIKQIETAEAEIETLNKDVERVEIRYRRKELSAEAHNRLISEYNRIKEQSENKIAEILLRLQEELR